MKTTVELPDDLMQAAKREAAKRRITLKRLFCYALRKEINGETAGADASFALSEDGMPYLPKRGATVRSEDVYRLEAEIDR